MEYLTKDQIRRLSHWATVLDEPIPVIICDIIPQHEYELTPAEHKRAEELEDKHFPNGQWNGKTKTELNIDSSR